MQFNLEINVFTVVFMLMVFLGLQMQVSGINKKLDELINKK
ncbi:MAG: hypothetical protein V1929_05925 [bacterium]